MALYKFFKPCKPSETLATEQNNLNKRESEKLMNYKAWKKSKKTTKVSPVSESRDW